MILKRALEGDIREASKYFPVVAILGPRQSGKTTLAQIVFNKHKYVTLEDIDVRVAAKQDPRTFLLINANEFGLIIDEFQYVPELLSYIQTISDKEKKMGFFVLTGSQNFLMNSSITQSLAGRVTIHTLLPLSLEELALYDLLPKEPEEILYKGCYPTIYANQSPPSYVYKNYINTYLERDVRQLDKVGDLLTFQTFVMLCAARTGQQLNITSLGNDCGISDNTARRWLSILEASYLIFFLRPYYVNYGKRLIKSQKIYFYDTGLVCDLLKIKEDELPTHPLKVNLFESLIISEIVKWHFNTGRKNTIFYWRDQSHHEVDCLIQEGRKTYPVEIKAGRTPNARFFEGINYWNKLAHDVNHSFVVYAASPEQTKVDPRLVSWKAMKQMFDVIKGTS